METTPRYGDAAPTQVVVMPAALPACAGSFVAVDPHAAVMSIFFNRSLIFIAFAQALPSLSC
ncbi:hypothetical protein P154DRAFT_94937 [Amniculicola lignicola CBS 123094]|uniref:Uncharacterized protein n=1 Tax=Amniculicola lignicola CBS 123094 TaxID=1392246 RepID=A0A6A5WTK9_9PLEO|nr:hypothetical protein P154DRAFT_94937 [Amniculicola lignicola CBS 123094]